MKLSVIIFQLSILINWFKMDPSYTQWSGIYRVKGVYNYQKPVEAQLAIELIQNGKEIIGKCLLKKQSIWKEDMHGTLEGILEDLNKKSVKLTLKWFNSTGFQNQSDLYVTMDNDYKKFEGVIKNMMYSGTYYGVKIQEEKLTNRQVSNTGTTNISPPQQQPKIRTAGRRRSSGSSAVKNETPISSVTVNTITPSNNVVNEPRKRKSQSVVDNKESQSVANQNVIISSQQGVVKISTAENSGIGLTKEDTNKCIICCENEKQSVFVPCGHKCCCETCAPKFVNKYKCPFCKKSVESIIKKVYE